MFFEPGEEILVAQDADDVVVNDRQRMLSDSYPKMAFIEHRLADDPTNWWALNASCIDAMLRSCGMQIMAKPAEKIVLCRPVESSDQ